MFSLLARALANQGRLADAILWCDRWVAADKLDAGAHYLRAIVRLEDGEMTKKARAEQLGDKELSLTITEGKKHQVRRMLAAAGYVVRSLKRVRIMGVQLEHLKPGDHRVTARLSAAAPRT